MATILKAKLERDVEEDESEVSSVSLKQTNDVDMESTEVNENKNMIDCDVTARKRKAPVKDIEKALQSNRAGNRKVKMNTAMTPAKKLKKDQIDKSKNLVQEANCEETSPTMTVTDDEEMMDSSVLKKVTEDKEMMDSIVLEKETIINDFRTHLGESITLTDKILVGIANCIGDNWEVLALNLEIRKVEIEHIKKDNSTEILKIKDMLSRWRDQKSQDATKENLLNVMCKMQTIVTIDWENLHKCLGDIVKPYIAAEFIYPLTDMTIQEGKDLEMFVKLSRTGISINWIKDCVPLKLSTRVKILCDGKRHVLQITSVIQEDSGKYIAQLPDKKESSANVQIIEIPLEFHKSLHDQTVQEEQTLTLECQLSKPNVAVKWLKNGKEIQLASKDKITIDQYHHRLIITDVAVKDAAKYTCFCGDVGTECTVTVEEMARKVNEIYSIFTGKKEDNIPPTENVTLQVLSEMAAKVSAIYDIVSRKNGDYVTQIETEKRNELKRDLIQHYRRHWKKHSIPFLPFEERIYEANLLQCYVPPILKFQISDEKNKTIASYLDIFPKDSKEYKNIYISSPAGCGKTFFCKRIALTWCQAHAKDECDATYFSEEDITAMNMFAFVFLISLPELNVLQCDMDHMIQKQLLDQLANPHVYSELHFLQKLLQNEKCLILLDGLDDWSHPQNSDCVWSNKTVPHRRLRHNCTVLTTSRPWKINEIRLAVDEIDMKLELNGLEDYVLKRRLVNNVIQQMNQLNNKNKGFEDFHSEILSKSLDAICKIPVILLHLLTLWLVDKPIGQSQCEIYCNLVKFLFERDYIKRKIERNVSFEDEQGENCCNDGNVLECFRNIAPQYQLNLISSLGKLAFNTLFNMNQEYSGTFELTYAWTCMPKEDYKICRQVGILNEEETYRRCKATSRKLHVSFLDQRLHEFLAAYYIAQNQGRMDVETAINKSCCCVDKVLQMSHVFTYMSGLCPQALSRLGDHLKEVLLSDKDIRQYRSSGEVGRVSNGGKKLRKTQIFILECLKESCLQNTQLSLPFNDCFVDGDLYCMYGHPWSDLLKQLVSSNEIKSLFVHMWSVEDIMRSVENFGSIQKLVLSVCSLDIINACIVIQKLRDLEYITLFRVTIPGDKLCLMIDSILQLPKELTVNVEECKISPGSKHWKNYIMSHSQLDFEKSSALPDNDSTDNVFSFRLKSKHRLNIH